MAPHSNILAWRITVYAVTVCQTWLSNFHFGVKVQLFHSMTTWPWLLQPQFPSFFILFNVSTFYFILEYSHLTVLWSIFLYCCSVTQLCPALQPHRLQHARLPCPSSPGVCSNSCPLNSDAIQPSFPLSSPSPPARSLSQLQRLFQWVGSLQQMVRVLELQLPHQSFQWIFRVDFFQAVKSFFNGTKILLSYRAVVKLKWVGFVQRMYMCVLSRVWLFTTPWTVADQAPLSMGFSRQEYWGGLLFPPPGQLPDSGIQPESLVSPALAGGFFTTDNAT